MSKLILMLFSLMILCYIRHELCIRYPYFASNSFHKHLAMHYRIPYLFYFVYLPSLFLITSYIINCILMERWFFKIAETSSIKNKIYDRITGSKSDFTCLVFLKMRLIFVLHRKCIEKQSARKYFYIF